MGLADLASDLRATAGRQAMKLFGGFAVPRGLWMGRRLALICDASGCSKRQPTLTLACQMFCASSYFLA